MRPFWSASASRPASAAMKCSGKRVAFCSCPLRVAVTTTRPRPASGLRNSPLALAMLKTTTRRDGSPPSSSAYSVAAMSGPTRLNLACRPSNVPWPTRKTKTVLSGPAAARRVWKARRTSSAVARRARPPSGDSVKTVTRASSKPKRSTSARRSPVVHPLKRFANSASPLAPLRMTANLFGSAAGRAGDCAHVPPAATQHQRSTMMKRVLVLFIKTSGQPVPLAQEPLAAEQPDEQEEVDGHVPQVLRHRARVVGLPVGQVVDERAGLFERVVLAARLGGNALEQLLVERGVVELPVQLGDQELGLRRGLADGGAGRAQLDSVTAQLVRLELADVDVRLVARGEAERHLGARARGLDDARDGARVRDRVELLIPQVRDDAHGVAGGVNVLPGRDLELSRRPLPEVT